MLTFLYTAENRNGKSVTQRIRAFSLEHARQVLEGDGYTSIYFHYGTMAAEVVGQQKGAELMSNKRLAAVFSDTRWRRLFIPFVLLAFSLGLVWSSYLAFGGIFAFLIAAVNTLFCFAAVWKLFSFKQLTDGHVWRDSKKVRFWAPLIPVLTRTRSIDGWFIDIALACADARDGKVEQAFARMRRHDANPRISETFRDVAVNRIFEHAGDLYHEFAHAERLLAGGRADADCMLAFASRVARKKKDLARASALVRTAASKELAGAAQVMMPLAKGIIEVEAGNFADAEFHLMEANKQLEPFRHDSHQLPSRSLLNAYLAIVLAKLGRRDEARNLFTKSRRYLEAVGEAELVERCRALLHQ